MLMLNKQERKVIKLQLAKEETAIQRIERQYRNALRDIEDRIRMLQSDELTQSRIYQIQYQQALRGQVAGILDKLHGDEYATIQEYLHDSYQDGFIGTMYSIHGQGIPLIVPLDQDAAVKAILTDSKISEGLYKSIGVDVQHLKKTISNEITRGIASNLPFADIARNIKNRTKAPLSRAKTIVRTEAHRISQAAAADAREAAKERGCDVVKQWDSTLDSGTRPTHKRLDGQIRETDKPFEISDKKKAMYPGDFGYAEEDCNCRCVALTRAKWALDEEELESLKERAAFFGIDKKDDFKAFEEKYLKASETLKNQGKSGKIEPGGVLDEFDRKAQYVETTVDLKRTNPKYEQGAEYRANCQRCVPAFELRCRGYNVEAKPALVTGSGRLSTKDPLIKTGAWRNIFDGMRWKRCWRGTGEDEIRKAMAEWKDGARCEIYVQWKKGGAHVFVAEQVNGETRFYDPQKGSADCASCFERVKTGTTEFARIDNLPVSDFIRECVQNVR